MADLDCVVVETIEEIVRVEETGPPGPAGQPGTSGDAFLAVAVDDPSDTWVITHALNKYPSVTVVDSSKRTVVGLVTYNSTAQLTITFTAAFSGIAYLN